MRAMIKRLTFLSDAYNFLLLVYQRIFENKNFKNNLKIFFSMVIISQIRKTYWNLPLEPEVKKSNVDHFNPIKSTREI